MAGNATNALALVQHASDQCRDSVVPSVGYGNSPLNINVASTQVQFLQKLLDGELQRCRALVEIGNLRHPDKGASGTLARPLVEKLSEYPGGGVDLKNIVVFPPQVELVPVKPLFLDVAWNYVDYPSTEAEAKAKAKSPEKAVKVGEEQKPQKRGWFGFGR